MSATELSPQGTDSGLARLHAEEARKARASQSVRASTDFYGGVGWLVGLLLTLFISLPVIYFINNSAARANRATVLTVGIAIAWWLNPLSLGALGYVLSNI